MLAVMALTVRSVYHKDGHSIDKVHTVLQWAIVANRTRGIKLDSRVSMSILQPIESGQIWKALSLSVPIIS